MAHRKLAFFALLKKEQKTDFFKQNWRVFNKNWSTYCQNCLKISHLMFSYLDSRLYDNFNWKLSCVSFLERLRINVFQPMCFVSSFASEKLSKRPKGFASWLFFTPTFSLDKTGSNLRSLEKSLLMTNRLSSLHKLKTTISRNKKQYFEMLGSSAFIRDSLWCLVLVIVLYNKRRSVFTTSRHYHSSKRNESLCRNLANKCRLW